MNCLIDPQSGVPFYRQIIERVRFAIASGELKPGEQVPTVRQLAVDLSINPNTVVRAYGVLEHKGLISSKTGSGTFVTDPGLRDRDAGDLHALAENREDFDTLMAPVYRFVNDTPQRVPLTDWYWTHTADHRWMQARPVVGGVFIKMLDDPKIWAKWSQWGK